MARARSFGNIRQLPSGRYQARYWHLGRQIPADTTFANKTDARRWLATIEADMFRGVWIDPNAGKIPFGEYATRWVAERPVRPRTREIYEGQLRHIVAVFADVHLCDVHPVGVRWWHGRLAASGLHHNTVAKIYRLFRSIMTTAVDDGLIARNPVRIKGASAERMIERPLLRWDDVRALAGAIYPRFECLVWTAAASGLRFGELAGLTIEHVNLKRRELRVMQALHYVKGQGPTLGPPKTESAVRTVPVADSIAVRLAAHIEEYVEEIEPGALVFTSLRGGPLLNTYFAPQWSKARDAVGLRHVRFHDLRHLAGTEAATAGASLREVMSIMGHASSAASLRYLKAAESRSREIADAIGRRMES
jgi:integrase